LRAELTSAERRRLLALDAGLRAEAEGLLRRSGIGAILVDAGYVLVGSYTMRAMAWRDLDFECYVEEVDWERHWEVGTQLAKTGWCLRLACSDGFRRCEQEPSYYWGIRAADPALGPLSDGDPRLWKLDLHQSTPEHFARALGLRPKWSALLTDETRAEILAIKEAVCCTPEYRRGLLSVHIYEAVLEHGVRGLDAFREWWSERYGGSRG
jgi:hypothetical protein